MTTGLVAQHQQSSYADPQDGQNATATVVLSNDNTTATTYNTHDADGSIHLQSSVFASRAAAGTAGAGAKWLTAETSGTNVRLFYSDGSSWLELNNFGTAATFSAAVTLLAGMTSSATTASNVFLGLGASTAAQRVIIASNTATAPPAALATFISNTGINVLAAGSGVGARVVVYSAGVANGASIILASSGGAFGSLTATQSGDNVGLVRFTGYNGANFGVGAIIAAAATQTWTTAAQGTSISFFTTPNGSTSPNTVLTLGQDGTAQFLNAISVGNATPTTSGAGITFPATQSSSTNVNTLDDYAEGTWTPADGSGAGLTFTSVVATYEKIGRTVIARCTLTYPVTADGTNAKITGLPFTVVNSSAARQGFVSYTDETTLARTFPDASAITFQLYTTAGANITNATMSANQLYCTLIYPVV